MLLQIRLITMNISDIKNRVNNATCMFMSIPKLLKHRDHIVTIGMHRALQDIDSSFRLSRREGELSIIQMSDNAEGITHEDVIFREILDSLMISEKALEQAVQVFEDNAHKEIVKMALDRNYETENSAILKLRLIDDLGYSIKTRMFHQTSAEAKESIIESGFELKKRTNSSTDKIMPDGVFTKKTRRNIGLRGANEQILIFPKKGMRGLTMECREDFMEYLMKNHPNVYKDITQVEDMNIRRSEEVDIMIEELSKSDDIPNKSIEVKASIERWRDEIMSQSIHCRKKISEILKSIGVEKISFENDKGVIGETDTTIILNKEDLVVAQTPHLMLEKMIKEENDHNLLPF